MYRGEPPRTRVVASPSASAKSKETQIRNRTKVGEAPWSLRLGQGKAARPLFVASLGNVVIHTRQHLLSDHRRKVFFFFSQVQEMRSRSKQKSQGTEKENSLSQTTAVAVNVVCWRECHLAPLVKSITDIRFLALRSWFVVPDSWFVARGPRFVVLAEHSILSGCCTTCQ